MASVYRKSPFDGLLEHADKVKECVKELSVGIQYYTNKQYGEFELQLKKVSALEHEADLIKGNIRNHLPKSIFMPVDKSIFLMLLKEQDTILDHAEDVMTWLNFRRTEIPDELKSDFLLCLKKTVDTVEAFERTMVLVKKLLETSFAKNVREECKHAIHQIHKNEYESDEVERLLTKKIFSMEETLGPMGAYHLLRAVDMIGDVANHAENAGDRVRAMIAK